MSSGFSDVTAATVADGFTSEMEKYLAFEERTAMEVPCELDAQHGN